VFTRYLEIAVTFESFQSSYVLMTTIQIIIIKWSKVLITVAEKRVSVCCFLFSVIYVTVKL